MPHQGVEKPRSENCLRHRSSALRHSHRLYAAAGTLPPPFLEGRKSIEATTCTTFARHIQLRSRIRIGNPLFSGCATLSTPTTGAFTDAGRHALDPEHAPAMSIACVVSDAHACGPSVYLGGGDAERARIRLIGRSKTARCNWRSDFRKRVFPLAHAHAPLFDRARRRGPKTFFRKPLRQLRRAGPHCLWRRRHAESQPFRRLRGGRGP